MAGPTRSRDELISSFAGSLFAAMLSEVVMDTALQAHKDIVRSRAVCDVCGTRCGSVHAQMTPSNCAGSSTSVPLPPGSPVPAGKTVVGMSTPIAKDKNDGNIYFECTNCQKKIASNRYAPHLSGCLGIGTGSRRGAVRNAAAKNKLGPEPDRPGSPFVGSDYGSPSEAVNGKGKGKAKNGKKINGKASESGLNGTHKRPTTPDVPSPQKTKKQKTSAAGSEQSAAYVPDETNIQRPHVPTASTRPLKLATTSTSPYAPGSPSAASASQYSGHDSPSASGSGSSFNAPSPTGKLSSGHKISSGPESGAMKSKPRSHPPGSGKNNRPGSEAAAKRKTNHKEDPDFIDVDGEGHGEISSDSA